MRLYMYIICILHVLSEDNDCVFVIAITIEFSQSEYRIVEDSGLIQPEITLSNPSSFDITIHLNSADINTTASKCCMQWNSSIKTIHETTTECENEPMR